MEVEKLKVAELRSELSSRGADTEGTKAILVARLKEIIAQEAAVDDESPEPEVVEAEQVEPVEAEEAEMAPEEEAPVAETENSETAEAQDSEMVADEEEQTNSKEEEMAVKTDETPEVEAEEGTEAKVDDAEAKEEAKEDDAEKKSDESAGNKKNQRRGQKRKFNEDEPFVVVEDEPDIDADALCLDWFNSDLTLRIDKEGGASAFMTAEPLHKDGWGYVWSGARATHGFRDAGKVGFEVKLLEDLESKLEGEKNLHELRLGWSTDDSTLMAGEAKHSYCYSGSGKKGSDCAFEDYGATFEKDDVVGAFLDLSGDKAVMTFTKNGESQEVAFEVEKSDLEGKALFPTVNSRNVKFEVNFGKAVDGEDREEWFAPLEGYVWAAQADDKVAGPPRMTDRSDCEMIMMVGLPASGKTTWVSNYVKENPEKRFNVIGTAALIEKMKVNGESRKQHYEGKWDLLIQKCTRCLQDWLKLASQRRRNYIIDQTNVYPNAQRRKVRPFEGMVRKAVVIVPAEEDYKSRAEAQEKADSKDVPDNAVMEMKANFALPVEGDDTPFKEIVFVELQREEAAALVETYNKDAKEKGFGKRNDQKHKRQRGNFNKNRGGNRGRFMQPFRGGRGGRGNPMMRGGMRGGMRGNMRGGMRGGMRAPNPFAPQRNGRNNRGNRGGAPGGNPAQKFGGKQQQGGWFANGGGHNSPWNQWPRQQQQQGGRQGGGWGPWGQQGPPGQQQQQRGAWGVPAVPAANMFGMQQGNNMRGQHQGGSWGGGGGGGGNAWGNNGGGGGYGGNQGWGGY